VVKKVLGMFKRFFIFLCLTFMVVAVPAYATLPQNNLDAIKARALKGEAHSQNHLGVIYADQKNYDYASVWFRRAALQGDAFGQYGLATLYKEGLGLPKDYTKAAQWYFKAARQGDAKAQYHLGTLYYAGAGVKKDVTKAISWFLKSAEAGDKQALKYLQLISHRNQLAINEMGGQPLDSVELVKQDLSNFTEEEVSNVAGNSLGLMYLQGAGATVGLEAIFLWMVVPLLCILGFFAL
jgi:TPR repeat protein